MPILSPQSEKALEDLLDLCRNLAAKQGSHRDRRVEETLTAAGEVIQNLRTGVALQAVLLPMMVELEAEAKSLFDRRFEFRDGGPREWAQGKSNGIEHAVQRIARDNVVIVE